MKGVPIKFRAKGLWGKGYEYGLLTKKKLRNSGEVVWAIAKGNCSVGETIPVIYESVSQLVGYDDEGAEVYEGDTIDAYIDDNPEPVYTFQAALVNNFFVPKNMSGLKHVVRKNNNG